VVFGKIEYLNLLPFHVFMKRYAKTLRHHATIDYKKGVPSKINNDFLHRRVDAAFISSAVTDRRGPKDTLGIIAKKEVLSVLVLPNEQAELDSDSATSNLLTEILHLQGKVLIGDKALLYYLQHKEQENYIDLAKAWYDKFYLPFVFAILSSHNHHKQIQKMAKRFQKNKIYIPQYILEKAALRSNISKKDILHYLHYISYHLDIKSIKSIHKFLALKQYK